MAIRIYYNLASHNSLDLDWPDPRASLIFWALLCFLDFDHQSLTCHLLLRHQQEMCRILALILTFLCFEGGHLSLYQNLLSLCCMQSHQSFCWVHHYLHIRIPMLSQWLQLLGLRHPTWTSYAQEWNYFSVAAPESCAYLPALEFHWEMRCLGHSLAHLSPYFGYRVCWRNS